MAVSTPLPALPTAPARPTTGPLLLLLLGLALALPQLLLPYLAQRYALHPSELEVGWRAYWGASLLAAVPAGWLVARAGYGRSVAAGAVVLAGGVLALGAAGAGWGVGLATAGQGLLGTGSALLQVAALAYLTSQLPTRQAALRLTAVSAAQALGATLLPMLGGPLLGSSLASQQLGAPYLTLAGALLGAAALAGWQLPPLLADAAAPARKLRHLPPGLLAAASCAGVPAGLGVLFLFYGQSLHLTHLSPFTVARLHEVDAAFNAVLRAIGQPATPPTVTNQGLTVTVAATLLALYALAALLGRLAAVPLLAGLPSRAVLAGGSLAAAALVAAALLAPGDAALWLLVASGLASGPLWPLVAARALTGLGRATPLGAGLLVLASIVGGAAAGPLLGWLAAHGGWSVAFGMVAAGYGYVAFYALRGSQERLGSEQAYS